MTIAEIHIRGVKEQSIILLIKLTVSLEPYPLDN